MILIEGVSKHNNHRVDTDDEKRAIVGDLSAKVLLPITNFECLTCQVKCQDEESLTKHYDGKAHKRKIEMSSGKYLSKKT